ncbi:aminoglycoside phosphotransferase family protein [Microlunatus sp. GCM10028923]|uniref:aminoglycoside phosphotransferase family protein n=1 Tax=Microlunatus sp. GCM10028923 TaxID=3273400 RepID=UPI003606CC93
MQATELARAVTAARRIAVDAGLEVDDAVVLQNSNKAAVRLLPCDVLARVAPVAEQCAEFEIELAQALVAAGSPVAALDPRVAPLAYQSDGFVITLWTYHATVITGELPPDRYADALHRLHAGMRTVEITTPHFSDRVEEARLIISNRAGSPELGDADRELLLDTLTGLGRSIAERGRDQLLHGEPHPGNLLATAAGPLFIDLETCCRGPVEFDLAHAPEAVGDHYPGVDRDLLRDCRLLALAVNTSWRWEPNDQLPDGRRLADLWVGQLRAARSAS